MYPKEVPEALLLGEGTNNSFCYIGGTTRTTRRNSSINIGTNANIKSIINPSTLTSANTNTSINRHVITSSSAKIHIHIKTSTNAI